MRLQKLPWRCRRDRMSRTARASCSSPPGVRTAPLTLGAGPGGGKEGGCGEKPRENPGAVGKGAPWFPPTRAEGSSGAGGLGSWLAGPPEGARFLVGLAAAPAQPADRTARPQPGQATGAGRLGVNGLLALWVVCTLLGIAAAYGARRHRAAALRPAAGSWAVHSITRRRPGSAGLIFSDLPCIPICCSATTIMKSSAG
jgi:hypothetical protein